MFTVPPESSGRVQPGELADSLCVTRSDMCQAIKAAAVANGDKLKLRLTLATQEGSVVLLYYCKQELQSVQ